VRSGDPAAAKNARKIAITLLLSDEDELAWNRIRDLLSHRLGSRSPEAALRWLIDQGLEKLDPVRVQARQEARVSKRAKGSVAQADSGMASNAATSAVQENAASLRPENDALNPTAKSELPEDGGIQHIREHIPAASKRSVWIRCKGRCCYRDPVTGRICDSTTFLDFDHVIPLSQGGSNEVSNLRLACASHNRRRQNWERPR
jgi:hypothetical protein